MPSPGYTSPKTAKGRGARERAFWKWAYEKINPKPSGSGMRRRGVMVPRLDKKTPRPAPSYRRPRRKLPRA